MRDKFDLKELTNEIPLGEFLKYDEPLLVSRTNAVSGKLLLASEMSRFNTVGYDFRHFSAKVRNSFTKSSLYISALISVPSFILK